MHRIEAYIRLAIIFIIILNILALPFLLHFKKKGISITRQMSYLGLIYSIFLIVFATILFVPITLHPSKHILNIKPFNWLKEKNFIELATTEKLPNIMLFIPFGFFLPLTFQNKRKLSKTVFISLIITFSVEFIQYFIGRSSDIDDIIMNLLGAIIGYIIFKVINNFLSKKNIIN